MSTHIPATPGSMPPRKKTSPWVWIVAGVLGFLLLIVVALSVGAYFVYHKAREYGVAAEKNPGLAAAKLLAAINPDVEVVSTDDNRGLITIRDKKTGKTVTINFEDIQKGRISFEEEGKERVSIEAKGEDSDSLELKSGGETVRFGAGGPLKLPDWFSSYPGAKVSNTYVSQGKETGVTGFHFTTSDSVDQVARFYERGLKKSGLKVQTHMLSANDKTSGGIVSAKDETGRRKATIQLGASGSGAEALVAIEVKK